MTDSSQAITRNVIPAAVTLASDISKTRLAAMYKKSPRTIGRWIEELGWQPGDPAPTRRLSPKPPAQADAAQKENPQSNQQVPSACRVGADPANPARANADTIVERIVAYVFTPFVFTAMVVCAAMNARYHWSLGEASGTTMCAGLAMGGFLNDGTTFLLPNQAKKQWRKGNRGNSVFLWMLWLCVFFPLTALSTLGFTSQNFGDAMTARGGILAQADAAADQRNQKIEIAKTALKTATEAKNAECGNGDPKQRGPRCRDYEKVEQQRLNELADANAVPIVAKPAISAPDPAADLVSSILQRFRRAETDPKQKAESKSATERTVQNTRVILMTFALTAVGLLL